VRYVADHFRCENDGFMPFSNKRPAWVFLTQHWLSLCGLALVATAITSWLFVLPLHIRGHAENPYVGIIAFLVIPLLFFCGLALIPIGIFLGRRSIRTKMAVEEFDRKEALRRIAWFFGVTTVVNVLIGTQITYRAVEHMETPQFCGATCHVMAPEFAAYQNSPHAKVECVECHVAPGATGWIESKMAGSRQLVETLLNTSPRPIPSGLVSNRLVPATETCENCHWPQMFGGVRLRVINKFGDDEANSRTQTVLLMMIGGSKLGGIHGAHFGPGVRIRFTATDPARQTIPWVEYQNANTEVTNVFATSEAGAQSETSPKIQMECVDCHNRPTHAFELPDRAMDRAMSSGEISTTLPRIKKKGVEVLQTTYSSSKEAEEKIPASLREFYTQNYPQLAARSQDISQAAQAVLAIYKRNVFPELRVSWGTYQNNLGHTDFPGCFRCHDGSHVAKDGKTIAQDCDLCHHMLATDEASPEILKTLGVAEKISAIQKQ
jgi:NapC/NirT cytochrome c family, N-terminal region